MIAKSSHLEEGLLPLAATSSLDDGLKRRLAFLLAFNHLGLGQRQLLHLASLSHAHGDVGAEVEARLLAADAKLGDARVHEVELCRAAGILATVSSRALRDVSQQTGCSIPRYSNDNPIDAY